MSLGTEVKAWPSAAARAPVGIFKTEKLDVPLLCAAPAEQSSKLVRHNPNASRRTNNPSNFISTIYNSRLLSGQAKSRIDLYANRISVTRKEGRGRDPPPVATATYGGQARPPKPWRRREPSTTFF